MNNDSSALPTFSSLISVSRLASALIRVLLTCVFAIGFLHLPFIAMTLNSLNVQRMFGFLVMIQSVSIQNFIFVVCGSVGVLLGAMTGAFIRKETAGGMLRGSIKGAISGALSSAQVAEDSLVIWKFNASGQWIIFYVVSSTISHQTFTDLTSLVISI